MGNLLCCVPCKKKKMASTGLPMFPECGTRLPIDTRNSENDDRRVMVTGETTGFGRSVRPSRTVRIVVDYFAKPVYVERSLLPDISAEQLEGYFWAIISRYTMDFSLAFVFAVLPIDSRRIASEKSVAMIEDRPDSAFAMIEERRDHATAMTEERRDHAAAMIEDCSEHAVAMIEGVPDHAAAADGLSPEEGIEERAQREKAAHLKAKRKANFKKLKAKMKAKKQANKLASSADGSPTVEISS